MIDSAHRGRAVLLAIGIPAYVVVGVALLLGGFPTWTALVLFGVAVLDGVWVMRLRGR